MIRNTTKTGLLLLLVCISLKLSACSVRAAIPQDGIFYCDELGILIDFSIIDTTSACGKVLAPDGSYIVCRCMIDYGSGIWICSLDQKTDYLCGKFQYKNGLFYITSHEDGIRYAFERQGTVCVNPSTGDGLCEP